jgi:hypothetical protein
MVEVEAFEEAFAHIFGQVGFFEGSLHEVNRPFGGVQNDSAVVALGKMFFEFLAELGIEIAVNVCRKRSK